MSETSAPNYAPPPPPPPNTQLIPYQPPQQPTQLELVQHHMSPSHNDNYRVEIPDTPTKSTKSPTPPPTKPPKQTRKPSMTQNNPSPTNKTRRSSVSNKLIQRKKANDLYNKLRAPSMTKRNVFIRTTGRKVRNAAIGFWDKYIKRKNRNLLVTNRVARHNERKSLKRDDEVHEKERANNKEHNLKVYRHAIGIPKEINKLEHTRMRINNRLAELETEKNELRIFVENFEKDLQHY